jgi:DsbC/DsbD-like thiol-disulfide interchange protein
MKKFIFTGLFFIFALFFVAETNAQTISGTLPAVKRGGTTKGTIVMSIPGGLHVNSYRPNSEYAIPTIVRITGAGLKFGAVNYPRGKNRKFGFSEDSINVYEGRTTFTFNVTVPANFKGNTIKIRAVVRYQACTDEVCYPPKSKEITLTARVN